MQQQYQSVPYMITTTTESGEVTHIYTIRPPELITSDWASSTYVNGEPLLPELSKYISEEEHNVNIIDMTPVKGEYIVACKDKTDLAKDNVLKTLSRLKGKLMLQIAPVHIQKIECSITPEVRKNIVEASKRLRMYGKRRPIVARFDDYGNRLPDELELPNSYHGITLRILDPKFYGDMYLEMRAFELPSNTYHHTR